MWFKSSLKLLSFINCVNFNKSNLLKFSDIIILHIVRNEMFKKFSSQIKKNNDKKDLVAKFIYEDIKKFQLNMFHKNKISLNDILIVFFLTF